MAHSAKIRITRVHEGALDPQLERGVDNLSENVARRMRRLVPKRSFRLHDTIEKLPTTRSGNRIKGGVRFGGKVVRGKLVDYHLMVERGTSRMAAQPYARPALYQSRSGDLVGRMADA